MFPHTHRGQFHKTISRDVQLDYLLTLPDGYDQEPERAWPLLLTLHGGTGPEAKIENIAIDLDIARAREANPEIELPFVILSPRCPPENRGWEPFQLHALLDWIEEEYRIDTRREYVTGFSMGGFGLWRLAASAPERFAALAPLAGWANPVEARWLSHVPTWLFHGALDDVVPVAGSELMAEALRARGGNAKLTIYPDLMHPILAQTYSNPELYRWFLSHTRQQG